MSIFPEPSSHTGEPRSPLSVLDDFPMSQASTIPDDESCLSSAPSGILTPTNTRNSAIDGDERVRIQDLVSGTVKNRKSYVWLPENGIEYQKDGKLRWRCARCMLQFIYFDIDRGGVGLILMSIYCIGANSAIATTYSDSSTRNMIEHLREKHSIGKKGATFMKPQEQKIRVAFGNTMPKLSFNHDLFKQLLVNWIVTTNVSFHQVEDPAFRLLLSYLCAVVCSLFQSFNRCLSIYISDCILYKYSKCITS